MKFRVLLIPCLALIASAVLAQTAPPAQTPPSDQWHAVPASASSSSYRTHSSLPGDDRRSPFKFKQPGKRGPAYEPPPQANDKAAVMGKQRPWQNGRPPVDCALEPRDPACH
ncbi:MAG TPA: hypothetical protein VN043_09060 [Rhodanobacter sp.]|nr:hypothetical protein [Rhodanobacter sp.]